MTKEQQNAFYRAMQFLNGHDLLALKDMVEDQIQYAKHLKENFYLNDTTDDYIYIVHYRNGKFHYVFKGADAYNEYMNNEKAWKLERKSKALFPTYESLMEKTNGKEKVRSELSQNEIKANQIQSEQRNRLGLNLVS